MVIVFLWAYYSSQILLLGAEFTRAYAMLYGSHIRPADDAERVPVIDRARQGIAA